MEQAYKVATLLERPGAKEVILQAAKNLAREGEGKRAPMEVLRLLAESLNRSKKFTPVQKQDNVGAAKRVTVTRNARSHAGFPAGAAGGRAPRSAHGGRADLEGSGVGRGGRFS
jgi:hypothetical protein